MTVRTRLELETAAGVIRDETGEGANTAARVGGFLRDAVDSMPLASELSGGAPTGAEYFVGVSHGSLSAERVITDTATIVWDLATGGIARANVPDGSLSRAKLANASDLSVVGRAAPGAGPLQDIPAITNDRIFARVSNVLGFFQVTRNMIQSGELITAHYELDSVTNAVLRNSGACSVIARSANSSGDPGDISATVNDRLFCRVGDTLQFTQLTAGMVPNDLVTNAMSANMAQATLKGRASGAGSGDPTDLTPAQARTVLGVNLVSTYSGSGSWDKDATAVWIDFVLVGAGGGGGAVSGGIGGGGGGPGAIVMLSVPASEVPEDLTITIGTAGTAGSNGGNTTVSGVGFSLIAPGGLAGTAGGAGGAAGPHGINGAVSGGAGGASSGADGSLNPFGGLVGSGATGGPGTGGGGYGAGGGGGAGATDGGGGGAGGYAGSPAAGNGTATTGGAGTGGFVAIIERRG